MKTVVFTDLDATLLDSETYSWVAATDALEALKERQASIVLVSSKTLAEMELLYRQLSLADPFVVENGGGIIFSPHTAIADQLIALPDVSRPVSKGDLMMLPLGVRYEHLVDALAEISREISIQLTGFSAMSSEQIASLTGLSIHEAELAKDRDFDEPFIFPEQFDLPNSLIQETAWQRGLTAVQGGRFWHLIGHDGKGRAVSLLIDAFRRLHGEVITIGLGDSPNDFPFLELVDFPVVVGGSLRRLSLPDSLKRARLTSKRGPEGWNGAILAWLSESRT